MRRRFLVEFGLLTAVLTAATGSYAADHDAVLSGVVRDAKGVPQMGALVQILSATNSAVLITTFTDLQGRYLVRSLLPGRYGIRASAVLFLPASRENLHLQPDHRSVVNLTLSGLLDDSMWLPARSKAPDEASDDWNWTLRSSAGRPILKLDEDGTVIAAGSGEAASGPAATRVRANVQTGSKTFGEGSLRAGIDAQTRRRSGTVLTFESVAGEAAAGQGVADGRTSRAGVASKPEFPMEVAASIERTMGSTAMIASRLSYASHPEIMLGDGGAGLKVVSLSSAERFALGDFVEVEAGNRIDSISGPASVLVTRPFVRVSAHPAPEWTVTYRLASAVDLQDYDSALRGDGELPVAVPWDGGDAMGGVESERSRHQEISVSHRTRATLLELAYVADAMDRIALAGVLGEGDGSATIGGASATGMEHEIPGLLVDRSNGSIRALTDGYHGSGFNIVVTRAMGGHTWVALQYSAGSAMAATNARGAAGTGTGTGAGVTAVQARRSEAATVSVKMSVARTGTRLRTSYRWQPNVMVSSVDPFDALAGGAYLGFHVRQPLGQVGILPDGLELTVDGTNVLGQGYHAVRFGGGVPVYLAASPSDMRAGVAFSF